MEVSLKPIGTLRPGWKSYRNLLGVLARMHMRSSDYRTFLGAIWSLLGPILTFAVLYFIAVDRFASSISLFSIKLLSGIIAVIFFNSVIRIVMVAVRQSREVAIESLVPSEIFIAAPLIVPLVKFGVEMLLALLLAAGMGVLKIENLPWIFLTAVFFIVMATAIGLVLAVLDFFAADVHEIWSRIETLFLFITPVFYSLDSLSPWAKNLVLWLNPATPFVLCFQTFVSGQNVPGFDGFLLIRAIVGSLVLFFVGYLSLKKFEKQILEFV